MRVRVRMRRGRGRARPGSLPLDPGALDPLTIDKAMDNFDGQNTGKMDTIDKRLILFIHP
jgi:hypothetical protein